MTVSPLAIISGISEQFYMEISDFRTQNFPTLAMKVLGEVTYTYDLNTSISKLKLDE